ncbi:MAG: hypothetical protein ACRD12_13705 [Acidimicrobiales bacterium]
MRRRATGLRGRNVAAGLRGRNVAAGLRGLNAVAGLRGRNVAVVLLVVATACSGGGGGDDAVTDTTARPDSKAVAERANLQLEDFPPEWKSTPVPAETVAASEALGRVVAACLNRPPPEELRETIAYSPDFSASDTRRASSSVAIVKTTEFAEGDFAALHSDRGPECHKNQIDSEFARQQPGTLYTTTIRRVDMPQFGDDTVAYRINASTNSEGREVVTVIDEVFVRKGRAVLAAFFVNRSAAFPLELQRTLIQRMVGRT